MYPLMAWATEWDTLPRPRCPHTFPEGAVLHVRESADMVNFQRHIGCSAPNALTGSQSIHDLGATHGPCDVGMAFHVGRQDRLAIRYVPQLDRRDRFCF